MLKNAIVGMGGSREKSKEFGGGSLRERDRIHYGCASEGRSLRIRQSIRYRIKLRGIKLKEMPLNLRAQGGWLYFYAVVGVTLNLYVDFKLSS